MNATELTKVQKIADTYGYEAQREMLVEECAELIQAVQKLKRADNSGSAERIGAATESYIEELADVYIMVAQMRNLLTPRLEQDFKGCVTAKLDRQIHRIEQARQQEKEEYDRWRAGVQA